MSDRWTISTYLNGNIVDIGGYLNWREEDMFYEAVAIMAVFADCRTADDYWRLRRELSEEKSDKIYRFEKRSQDHHFKWWFENSPKRAAYIAA